ncbi:glycosyltransferase [Mycobacterium sp. SMC-4]|uniref:glycosyltransferase n=1 Tax=Mycobacterium sp. SMC-4 TaxID=2857059 RepID=UPI003D0927F7
MTDLIHDDQLTLTAPGRQDETTPARRPTVSICVPAYQAEQHLRPTVESLLAQEYDDFEVVIVDNHSSDATSAIVESFADVRVRLVRNDATVPIIDNFNRAVGLCRGEFVKLVCADDVIAPGCIATQADILRRFPTVALVGALTDFIDSDGELLRPARGLRGIKGHRSAQHVVRTLVRSGTNPIGAPVATMFRRADFDRTGGFRDDVELFYSDADLWVRLLQHGDFYGVPEVLASFRFGCDTVSATMAARSQIVQQGQFTRRLAADSRWTISSVDHAVGRLNAYEKQVRRTMLFALSRRRASRRRSARTPSA